ncbi:MAG: hypothetical protein AAF360_09995 [Pseudomonadota bacterium]
MTAPAWAHVRTKDIVVGAAHFPGTGPAGFAFADCAFFRRLRNKKEHEPGECLKWAAMMRAKVQKAQRITPTTDACKYFEARR